MVMKLFVHKDFSGSYIIEDENCSEVARMIHYNDEKLARLMASAPKLLEALEAITDLYNTDEGCQSLPEYVNARAAIAKAKGEQQ